MRSNQPPMPPLFRRLRLLFHALRYGARLIWLAAPEHHKLHWIVTLVSRVHESPGGRAGVHRALPNLGPLASAFAEALARRPELATGTLHDAIDAVSHLEAPLPPDQVEHAIAAALGRPVSTLFASIDLTPAKNGFAEQTHVARLIEPIDGHRDIALKLVRVAQVQEIADEAALLRWVARWMEKLSKNARRLRLREFANAFTQEILRRFDLRAEAANLSQTAHHFDGDKRLAIPAVIWELCTDRTLAMQHIESLPALDFAGLSARGVKLAPLAGHIIEVVTEQAFEHGFFHATFDAARVRVSIDPDTLGRIVLANFAVMSSLSSQEREFFVHGATALFEQDYGRLAHLHRDAGHVSQDTRPEKLEAELRTRAEAHFAPQSHERSAGALFHHLLFAVHPFGGDVPPRLAAAQRAFGQAEMLANALHPGIDSWQIARSVLATLARREFDHRGWVKHLAQELPHLAHLVPRIPQLAVQYLQHRHEVTTVRQQAQLVSDVLLEYRRTRSLLWACTVCGGLLGAIAVVLTY
ncbi:Predicted unusual protein kinase regulating ubiquinone biosynthesis, AarF/ABC1/UbiB family [Burkholderia sp. CF099]|nr:Predicted unusual protein kinase regulating ubiquinone biosynthesis, AarF/ABC1/UbiB family [Burkholderia sp. CF099]